MTCLLLTSFLTVGRILRIQTSNSRKNHFLSSSRVMSIVSVCWILHEKSKRVDVTRGGYKVSWKSPARNTHRTYSCTLYNSHVNTVRIDSAAAVEPCSDSEREGVQAALNIFCRYINCVIAIIGARWKRKTVHWPGAHDY